MITGLLNELEQPTGEEAGEQSAEEAGDGIAGAARRGEGRAAGRQSAADEADEQTGTVGYGHRDEAREYGQHKAERHAADGLEPRRYGSG